MEKELSNFNKILKVLYSLFLWATEHKVCQIKVINCSLLEQTVCGNCSLKPSLWFLSGSIHSNLVYLQSVHFGPSLAADVGQC